MSTFVFYRRRKKEHRGLKHQEGVFYIIEYYTFYILAKLPFLTMLNLADEEEYRWKVTVLSSWRGAYCWQCRISEQLFLPEDSFLNLGVRTVGFWECRVRQSDVEYGHSSALQYKYKITIDEWMRNFMWYVTKCRNA